jgi:hypothetical protein
MQRVLQFRTAAIIAALLAPFLLFIPVLASAQSTDLSSTIRSELLKDPRTENLSQTQLDAMVQLLSGEAQQRGITASDITWRPSSLSQAVTDVCGDTPQALCVLDVAFGFLGPDSIIAYILGASSMALIWLLAEMLHRRNMRTRMQAAATAAPIVTPPAI